MLLHPDKAKIMRARIKRFLTGEAGQDLIEYTLLIAVIMLSSAAILVAGGASMQGIWGTASNQLAVANAS